MATLDPAEREQLTTCEAVLAKACLSFVDAGRALTIIRDKRLYRDTHETFDDYCKEKWQIARQHAYHLIAGAAVMHILSTMVDKLPALPQNERQVRPMVGLRQEEVPVVWQNALAAANGHRVTGRIVAKAAAAFLPCAPRNQKRTKRQRDRSQQDAERNQAALSAIRELFEKAEGLIRDGAPAEVSLQVLEQIRACVEAALVVPTGENISTIELASNPERETHSG